MSVCVLVVREPGKMGFADDTNWALVISSEWLLVNSRLYLMAVHVMIVKHGHWHCSWHDRWWHCSRSSRWSLWGHVQLQLYTNCYSSSPPQHHWHRHDLEHAYFDENPTFTHVEISYLVVTACQNLSRPQGVNSDLQPLLDTYMFTSCYHWLLRSVSGMMWQHHRK